MLVLGDCYEHGTGVPRNVTNAHAWLLKAAQGGDADGMLLLSDLLLSPTAGAGDEQLGVAWLTKAAEAGQTTAQTRLAGFLSSGAHGVKRDEAEALRWAQKAAIKDNQAAGLPCTLYSNGINGQPPDQAMAVRWCTAAAQSGQVEAMVVLAGLYLRGQGAMHDPGAALVWASIAAGQVTGAAKQEALRLQETASGLLSEPERSAALARAAAWRPMQ
jgi:TPR repeat protein